MASAWLASTGAVVITDCVTSAVVMATFPVSAASSCVHTVVTLVVHIRSCVTHSVHCRRIIIEYEFYRATICYAIPIVRWGFTCVSVSVCLSVIKPVGFIVSKWLPVSS